MKNTTILIILLLVVSSTLYIKQKEGLTDEQALNDLNTKNKLIDDISGISLNMTVDYNVFKNETTNMSKQELMIFYVLIVVTSIILAFTMYYVIKT